jgi:hypothetical protein
MKRLTSYLLLVLVFTGCATYSWYNPSKNQNEFYQDKYICIQQSAQAFPVVIQQQSYGIGYTTDSITTCNTLYGQTDCITTPGTYQPPATIAFDVNEGNRNTAFNACMNAKGWSLQKNP